MPGLHAFKFRDGVLLLSDSRLLLLASKLDMLEETVAETAAAFQRERASIGDIEHFVPLAIKGFVPPDPCAWNLLLRRRYRLLGHILTRRRKPPR